MLFLRFIWQISKMAAYKKERRLIKFDQYSQLIALFRFDYTEEYSFVSSSYKIRHWSSLQVFPLLLLINCVAPKNMCSFLRVILLFFPFFWFCFVYQMSLFCHLSMFYDLYLAWLVEFAKISSSPAREWTKVNQLFQCATARNMQIKFNRYYKIIVLNTIENQSFAFGESWEWWAQKC